MLGIVSYGAYIPLYRLNQNEIARAWGGRGKGERAVANFDEDSVTMAVAATIDCLGQIDRQAIDGLYFASTTFPYKEKQSATLIATAADLRRDITTADFSNSIRSGTIAMKAAIDAVRSAPAKKILVTAADCRLGAPQSEFERVFGDGAAALLIGDSDVAVAIESSYTHSDEFVDIWRTKDDTFVRSWEDRFILTEGYTRNTVEAISAIMKKHDLAPKDFNKVIFYAPDARRHTEMARSLGFSVETQVQYPMFDTVGNTGTAFALMMLVAALEEAKPGDRILFVNYGDGCDAYVLRVTEEIRKIKDRQRIKRYLASKRLLPNYERYIRNRGILSMEGQRRPPERSSVPWSWRERDALLRFYGSKCKRCGRLFYPPQRICLYCQSKDQYERVRLSDKRGKLFTFAKDNLALSMDPPLVLNVVDLDEGVRVYCQMTDRDPDEVEIGMPLEFTFRKMHEAAGFINYFWKSRPIR